MPDTPNPRKSLQQRALTSASASCCLLPTPPEPAVEMLTGKMGFLLPMPTSRQPSACGRSPGRSPAAERQEASVRPGRGTGPVYHNIPCRHLHCVQGSTLTKQISVLGPACMSCGLWVKETPSQGTSAAAVKGTPEAVQADTRQVLPWLPRTPVNSSDTGEAAQNHPGKWETLVSHPELGTVVPALSQQTPLCCRAARTRWR